MEVLMTFGSCLRDQNLAQPGCIRTTMQAGVFMDFWGIVGPIDRLIYVADNELFKCLVIGGKLDEIAERVPVVREKFGNCIADTLPDTAVVTL